MKVKELIQALESMNQELPVTLLHHLGAPSVTLSDIEIVTATRINQPDGKEQIHAVVIVDQSTRVAASPSSSSIEVQPEIMAPVEPVQPAN